MFAFMDACFHKNPENLGFSGNIRWLEGYPFLSFDCGAGNGRKKTEKKFASPYYVFSVISIGTIKSLHSRKILV